MHKRKPFQKGLQESVVLFSGYQHPVSAIVIDRTETTYLAFVPSLPMAILRTIVHREPKSLQILMFAFKKMSNNADTPQYSIALISIVPFRQTEAPYIIRTSAPFAGNQTS